MGYPQFARVTSARARTVVIFAAVRPGSGRWHRSFLDPPGPLIAVAVMAGAVRGCHTLLQATAVSDRWGTQDFGTINGVFTAPMTFVGAFAPVAGPAVAGALDGYPMMAAVMAVLLTG